MVSSSHSGLTLVRSKSSYRDAESYLARYQSLLTKALHLLEVGFVNHLTKVSNEISRQIAATQSESARHALAYGRFEEMLLDSYSLIPNVQTVVRNAYDPYGQPLSSSPHATTYANTASNLFRSYYAARERDLKPIIQHDLDVFRAEAKESVETAARNFVKQCFERADNEASLFQAIFSLDAHYSTDPDSAFVVLKSPRMVLTGANVAPIASNLQAVLQGSDLRTVCNLVGWIMHEYLLAEYDEEEMPLTGRSRGLAARLLEEHLWAFADGLFEAEITKTITKAPVPQEALKIGPVTDGDISSNAFPHVKKALELLVLFDQSMPKERCVCVPHPHCFHHAYIRSSLRNTNPPPATVQPGPLQNHQRNHRLPPAGRIAHPLYQAARHRPGPVHGEKPAHPQERAHDARDWRRARNAPRALFDGWRSWARRDAALLADLGDGPRRPDPPHRRVPEQLRQHPDDVHPRVVAVEWEERVEYPSCRSRRRRDAGTGACCSRVVGTDSCCR
jgi:hypothetical protein